MKGLKTKKEALDMIFEKWEPDCGTEVVELDESLGRVCAEDIYARYDIPVVRASAFDGIAVKSELFTDPGSGLEIMPDTENWIPGIDYARADTGDDFDDAFDAVIVIEMVTILENGGVRIDPDADGIPKNADRRVTKGANVRPAGSMVKKGMLAAAKGTRIRAEDIAAIAMSGYSAVKVAKKPVVAFIPTGSELVEAGSELERGQNYNSNGPMVKALLGQAGALPLIMPIVKDKKAELEAALRAALDQADIVVINGGSSKGEEDFNTKLISEMGDLLLHGVAAVPGRPTGIAFIDGKPVINTSGPAMASFYGLRWCVTALIDRMLGTADTAVKRIVTLAEDLHTRPVMSMMVRLNVEERPDGPVAYQVREEMGSVIGSMRTNAIFMTTRGVDLYPAGSNIEVEMRVI